ncbi:MAG: penicillin-binding protein 1C [Candidatus Muiribacteriota bacterium]
MKNFIKFLLLLFILMIISFSFKFIKYNPFPFDYSTVILDENGEFLRFYLNSEEQFIFPPDKNAVIPNKLEKSILVFEDRRFYYHNGVDFFSLFRAFYQNFINKKIVSGGSTVTMQISRMVFNRNRSFLNKISEIFYSFFLEFTNTKKSLLKLYIDNAPYGGNIRGYRAASVRYFKKNAENLTWAESAFLAVLPKNPNLSNSELLLKRRNHVLKKLFEHKEIDKITYELAIEEKIPQKEQNLPFFAPHFCDNVFRQHKNTIVKTSIDLKLQERIEKIASLRTLNLKNRGINNLSIIIIENKTGQIKSYIGNSNYWDFENSGMVDGVRACRSTGSILKPFLYAYAIENGFILPQTILFDVPTFYGSFSPVNFDNRYNGTVRAGEALYRSLNIPAVRLLKEVGFLNFYLFLEKTGISTLTRSPENYGLSMITGGVEARLDELTMLYSLMAQGKNPVIRDNFDSSEQILSKESIKLTLDILKNVKRPGIEFYIDKFSSAGQVSWKTGTSNGFKDAWAIGVTPEYSVGVWAGNFSGMSAPELTGYIAAAPVLFDVFSILANNKLDFEFEVNFKKIKICAETGYRATDNCKNIIEVDSPDIEPSIKTCPYHKKIWMNSEKKYEVCSLCWDENRTEEIVIVYPSDVSSFVERHTNKKLSLPEHNPTCEHISRKADFSILYPPDGITIKIPVGFDGKYQQIKVSAGVTRENEEIFWYINNKFITSTIQIHSFNHEFSEGINQITAVSSSGLSRTVTFHVNK